MEPLVRTGLERSILATLAYFDVFDYPLRVEEIWRWLYVPDGVAGNIIQIAQPFDVERAVRLLDAAGTIERIGSFVVLADRSAIVATRMQRKVTSERMWRRARFSSSILRCVPFVRFIGVVNTLAWDNARPESDIDFFIIVRAGRLWLTRFLVTTLTYLFGIRRHGRKIANRVCLSFFISDQTLSLEGLKFELDDPYLTFWISSVVPMFDRSGTWSSFRRQNDWILGRVPNGQSVAPAPFHADGWLTGMVRSLGELMLGTWLGNGLEQFVKFVQTVKMKWPSISVVDRGESGVVVSDEILKFHERDRRREYRQAFHHRLAEVA